MRSVAPYIVNDLFGPSVRAATRHYITHSPHAVTLLSRVHPERLRENARCGVDVPRVDQKGMLELAGGTGKCAENEHPALVVVCAHEFLAHEIHAVLKACNEAHVRGTKVAKHVLWLVVGFEHGHGLVPFAPKAQVDSIHGRADA